MATKKPKSDIVSLFEGVEEKGFGEVSSDDLRTPRITIIQAMSPQHLICWNPPWNLMMMKP